MQAMGLSGISKSKVSKLCKEIDERVNAFLDRPLAGEWPYAKAIGFTAARTWKSGAEREPDTATLTNGSSLSPRLSFVI